MSRPEAWSEWPTTRCWHPKRVEQLLSNVGAVTASAADFLAAHSPVSGIALEKPNTTGPVNDMTLYALLSGGDGRLAAFLKGQPGSGKSHLIRWLSTHWKEQRPEDHVLFVSRDDGTLKATLSRLVESLGEDSDLVSKLSDAGRNLTRRGVAMRLLQAFAFHLNPDHLQNTPEAIRAAAPLQLWYIIGHLAVQEALEREGGPIELAVDKLVGGKGKLAEASPRLAIADIVELERRCANVEGIKGRLARLVGDTQKMSLALPALNAALSAAIEDSVQIDPQALPEALRELRRRVHKRAPGRRIVLLIEDVSAFTGIDRSLIEVLLGEANASQPGMAPLLGVVGITTQYFVDLFAGQGAAMQRMTHVVSISGSASIETDPAGFAARYLNAVRARTDAVFATWSRGGAKGSAPSSCTDCRAQPQCHADFGTWQSADEHYGLYPFNRHMLEAAFRALTDSTVNQAAQQTPRTFKWLLGDLLNQDGEPDAHALRALKERQDPQRSPSRKQATSLVAQAQAPEVAEELVSLVRWWGDGTLDPGIAADDPTTVGALRPSVYAHFGLPVIRTRSPSRPETRVAPDGGSQAVPPPERKPPPPPPQGPPSDPLAATREYLHAWLADKALLEHQESWRDIAHQLLRQSVRWHEEELPERDAKLFPETVITFEGQRGHVAAGGLPLPRAPDVHDALLAAAAIREGESDEDGLQGRALFRFAARRGPEATTYIEHLLPKIGRKTWKPALGALQLLILDVLVSGRGKLGDGLPGLLNAAFSDDRADAPHRSLDKWMALHDKLKGQRDGLRELARQWFNLAEQRGAQFMAIASAIEPLRAFLQDLELGPEPPQTAFQQPGGQRIGHLGVCAMLTRKTRDEWLPEALGQGAEAAREIAKQLRPEAFGATVGPAVLIEAALRLRHSAGLRILGLAAMQSSIDRLQRAHDDLVRAGIELASWTAAHAAATADGFLAAAGERRPAQQLARLAALPFDAAGPVARATAVAAAFIMELEARRQGTSTAGDAAVMAELLESAKRAAADLRRHASAIQKELK